MYSETQHHHLGSEGLLVAAKVRIEGTVTRVILTRGFGFILADNQEEVFMHVDEFVDVTEWEKMRAGRRVSFVPTMTARGRRATEIIGA